MTQVGTVNVLSSTFYMIIYLFQMLETSLPRGGAYSVVVTINAAPSSGAVAGAISLWNVDQRGYQVTASNTITSNDVISVSITPNAYNSWIVSCVGSNAVGTYTATAPLVERYDYGAAGLSCTSSGGTMPDVSPVSTTVTETFVTGSARQAIFAATFPPHIYSKYVIFELGMNF
jgi:hypothetical protein